MRALADTPRVRERGVLNVLTHCNAGWLATGAWGTALAPVYRAAAAGIAVHVWVDETRPRNQGARLTAWELGEGGIAHSIVVDNCAGHLMQRGLVDVCIVGSDRTTRAGDVCNKIGTYQKALAAADNGVPFYVALPCSTIDWTIADGVREIEIEERDASEVLQLEGAGADGVLRSVRHAPLGEPGGELRLRRDAGAPGDRADLRARRVRGRCGGAGAAARRGRRCVAAGIVAPQLKPPGSGMENSSGLADLIGNTPLVRLRQVSELTGCEILGKAEFMNPGGSVKDRTALGIIRDAERRGVLRPGGRIVEGTAGNTGIGLSLLGNALGYRTTIVIPETQSPEKIEMLMLCGAELQARCPRCPPAIPTIT